MDEITTPGTINYCEREWSTREGGWRGGWRTNGRREERKSEKVKKIRQCGRGEIEGWDREDVESWKEGGDW